MNFIDWFFLIFSWLFFSLGIFILISCFIAFLRFKDFFIKFHAIKISNIYGISFILISLALNAINFLVFLQLFLVLILNVLITITISHSIARVALLNNIAHGGFSRKKYNEIMSEKEKQEAEKRNKEREQLQKIN